MDEARFGRINRPVRCWTPSGYRPTTDCQTVREYTYVYGGLCPHDGMLDTLILPTMHTTCFDLFCAEVSRRYPDELVIIVLDGAGSHTAAALDLPDNVRTLTLPPYSPELNPAEQLWRLIRKRRFANKMYDTLDDVEAALVDELRDLENDHDTIHSLSAYPWITSITLNAT